MAQLRQDFKRFEDQDTLLLVVGPESPKAFQSYWMENNLPFIGLPDPGHSVLKLYGQELNLFKLGRMPAMVVIDKKGIVRFAHYGQSMADIPDNSEVLRALRDINQEG
jgi:peroxiredoxin Q/BCP